MKKDLYRLRNSAKNVIQTPQLLSLTENEIKVLNASLEFCSGIHGGNLDFQKNLEGYGIISVHDLERKIAGEIQIHGEKYVVPDTKLPKDENNFCVTGHLRNSDKSYIYHLTREIPELGIEFPEKVSTEFLTGEKPIVRVEKRQALLITELERRVITASMEFLREELEKYKSEMHSGGEVYFMRSPSGDRSRVNVNYTVYSTPGGCTGTIDLSNGIVNIPFFNQSYDLQNPTPETDGAQLARMKAVQTKMRSQFNLDREIHGLFRMANPNPRYLQYLKEKLPEFETAIPPPDHFNR